MNSLSHDIGDLPESVMGSQKQNLDISGATSDDSVLDQVMASWAERKDGLTMLVPNSEYRASMLPKRTANISKAEALKTARHMVMNNDSLAKVEQYLEAAVFSNVLDQKEASAIIAEYPLLGHLYLDRNAVDNCSEIRKASQHPSARHALYVVMTGACKVCEKSCGGMCPECGKKLTKEIPISEKDLKEASQHMKKTGCIVSNAKIDTWADLKQAMTPVKIEIKERVYPHASPVRASQTKVDTQEALKNATTQEEKNSTIRNTINAREVLPIARAIGEMLLKGTDFSIVRKEVETRFASKDLVKSALELLHKKASPELLLTHMAAFPFLYDGDCHKCKAFLDDHAIKVASVFPIEQCKDCQNRKNATRSCSLLGAKIMGMTANDVDMAISELQAHGRLSSSDVRDLKAISDLKTRLTKAVRLAYSVKNAEPKHQFFTKNDLILSAESFAGRENSVLWAVDALSKLATVTKIKATLGEIQANVDQVLDDAIATAKTIYADSLDGCMTESYRFASNPKLIQAEKCQKCPYNDGMQCRQQGFVFSQDNTNEETAEVQDIRNFFAGSDMIVDVNAKNPKKMIDIGFVNEGSKLSVDLGKVADISYRDLLDSKLADVDVSPVNAGTQSLEIQSFMGGDGMDLSSIL